MEGACENVRLMCRGLGHRGRTDQTWMSPSQGEMHTEKSRRQSLCLVELKHSVGGWWGVNSRCVSYKAEGSAAYGNGSWWVESHVGLAGQQKKKHVRLERRETGSVENNI